VSPNAGHGKRECAISANVGSLLDLESVGDVLAPGGYLNNPQNEAYKAKPFTDIPKMNVIQMAYLAINQKFFACAGGRLAAWLHK
jgi:hypothetical protein